MRDCPQCGVPLRAGMKFCTACGNPASGATQAPAPIAVRDSPARSGALSRPRRMVVASLVLGGLVIASALVLQTPTPPPSPVGPPAAVAPRPPPPAVAAWRRIDTIGLGLKPLNAKRPAGLSFEISEGWRRVPLPEPYQLEFAAPGTGNEKLRVLIQAERTPANVPLARVAAAVKSTIRSGVDDYREANEADIEVALRPARRLTLTFQALDEGYPQHNEYLFVRAGDTVFTILVQGPQAKADAIRRALARLVETLAVAE